MKFGFTIKLTSGENKSFYFDDLTTALKQQREAVKKAKKADSVAEITGVKPVNI